MTQLTSPFHLQASPSSSDSPVTAGADLPEQVAGQPATYFWKEMIHAGNYVHPARKFSLDVDRDRLRRWAETGQAMLAAGVSIPINCDHSDRARDAVGYVKQFKLDGDRLLALCQFIGDDAALTAARNLVSAGIDPDFVDGHARRWGEAIVHLALTPVPVVPGQGQFMPASLAADADNLLLLAADSAQEMDADLPAISCSAEQFQALCDLIPGDEMSADNCIDRVIQYLQDVAAAKAGNVPAPDSPGEDAPDLEAELSAARARIVELSARLPAPMSEEAQAAIVESATGRFDAAVAQGGLSPAVRDRLVAALVRAGDGRANLIALSRTASAGGARSLALAVADILLDNRPLEIGERTGLQTLSRQVPGEEVSPVEQLRQYMTRIASVSG